MNKIHTHPYKTVQGTISVEKSVYESQERIQEFEKKIKLMNGDPLKVSPLELTFRVQIIENLPDGKYQVKYKTMPGCLFSQALMGDKICYTKGNKEYELKWTPYCHVDPTTVESPCTCDKVTTVESPCTCDKVIEAFTKKSTEGTFGIIRNNTFYALSPETKRVPLNQIGAQPVEFDDLKFAHCSTAKRIEPLFQNQEESGITLAFDAYRSEDIEILLDEKHFFITIQSAKNSAFSHLILGNGKDLLDENKTAAWIEESSGVLWIKIPFTHQIEDNNKEARNEV